jgi:hypothetical protein
MSGIIHRAAVPNDSLTSSSSLQHIYCPLNQARLLPAAVRVQLPAAPPTESIFGSMRGTATTTPAHYPMMLSIEYDDNGDIIPPTTSEITTGAISQFAQRSLDPQTPVFRSSADKEAFVRTLPTATQLQLDQPFGKDQLNQSFYVQKSGQQALFLLFESGFMSARVKKKLERVFPPARILAQLLKKYSTVDFRPMQGFQPNWEQQTSLSRPQLEMTTACLFHFKLSLPAMVRWIGGPHVGAHRDNRAIFAIVKEACEEENYQDLVRIFTTGSPAYINAECSQENYRAYRDYGNHSSLEENPALVEKTLLKDVKRGCSLMLDPLLLDFLENTKTTPHGIVNIGHPYKNLRLVCDSSFRPHYWCFAINDWCGKATEPLLIFADSFVETLIWIWNLRITYPFLEIYLCDDDITNAFRQVKYPPNLTGLHCKVVNGVLYMDTGQTFGDTPSPANFEPIAICRSQLAKYLWNRFGTVQRTLPLLPKIEHQAPPTPVEVSSFVQANRDSRNQGVLDKEGNRLPPLYRHHVDDSLYADIEKYLVRTVCASALALYEILGFPTDTRQIGAMSMDKLDTMYRPERKMVGYTLNTRAMTVALLQYKRDQMMEVMVPWITMPCFTLLQGAELCGKLESVSQCNRWIRPYFFSVQNAIRKELQKKWQKIQGYYKRVGIDKTHAKYALPQSLEKRLVPLIARDKAQLLWHSNAQFKIPENVQKDLALLHTWLSDPAVIWEKSIAHWIPRDPTFVSAGDASQVAGGAITEELKFWFDVQWTERVRRGCKLPSSDPEFIHINVLEFIVVLIQLAACIVAVETDYAKSICGEAIPEIPHLLVWTDNTASKSWSNKLTTSSPKAQPLLGILSRLLQRNNIGFESGHIAGVSNDGPDFISRPDLANEIALTHFDRSIQILMNDKRLKSWAFFRPSQDFLSLLASTLFSGQWAAPPSLPKTLGHFETGVSTGSSFVRI